MEIPHIEVKVLLSLEARHLLHDHPQHAPRAGSAAVNEPIVALALVALFPETYFRGVRQIAWNQGKRTDHLLIRGVRLFANDSRVFFA